VSQVLFADTSFFIALLNPDDDAHSPAVHWSRAFKGEVITTQWVLAELGNFLATPSMRALFAQVISRVTTNPKWRVIHADDDQFQRGSTLYNARPDKAWSLIDCISFIVMEDAQVAEALTTDHHFKQSGFETPMLDG